MPCYLLVAVEDRRRLADVGRLCLAAETRDTERAGPEPGVRDAGLAAGVQRPLADVRLEVVREEGLLRVALLDLRAARREQRVGRLDPPAVPEALVEVVEGERDAEDGSVARLQQLHVVVRVAEQAAHLRRPATNANRHVPVTGLRCDPDAVAATLVHEA